jgi:peptidoglycan/xylan/chitin deacetylase (PgdA/CDA1 family)
MDNRLYTGGVKWAKAALLHTAGNGRRLPVLVPGAYRILMYHRFGAVPDLSGARMDAGTFAWQLAHLKQGWQVIPLGDLLEALREGRQLSPRTAVITVDDGYLDFYQVAYPLLRKFGLPATFFATLNFVAGRIWLWPDILAHVLAHTRRPGLQLVWGSSAFDLPVQDPAARQGSWQRLSDYCSELPDGEKWAFIRHLANTAGVAVPPQPPPDFAPVNFDQLAEMSRNGIEIGAHSLNHPILSQVDGPSLVKELCEPKQILEERLRVEVRSLAYPSGRAIDLNPDVVEEARRCGYAGAVVTRREHRRSAVQDRFQLPRMGVGNDRADFCWKLYGLELFAESVKRYWKN